MTYNYTDYIIVRRLKPLPSTPPLESFYSSAIMDVLRELGPLPAAFGLGTLLHMSVLRNFELDTWIPHVIGASLVSFASYTCYHWLHVGLSLIDSHIVAAAKASCFIAGIFTSMTIYRLFFHRIRNFPGPFWAKITRFYALGLSSKNDQYPRELRKLHEKYGDFVRTGKPPSYQLT